MPEPSTAPQTITTTSGRTLAYLEVGDVDGPLVLHNHGGPGSRYEARFFAGAAARNGLRLLCVDRPGMGRSTPAKGRTFADWAQDLITVADTLGYQTFGVTGWSEGGPWALAAAAYLDPARLQHVTSIAPGSYGAFGDNSAAQYLSRVDALGGALALRCTPAFRVMYAAIGVTARHLRSSFVKQVRNTVNESDRQILQEPQVATVFAEEMAECFAQGSAGLVQDAELLYRRWPFDVAEIQRPVHLWQGLEDRLVPHPINQAVADRMPGAVWHPVAGAGHFVAIGCAEEILAVAAADLGA